MRITDKIEISDETIITAENVVRLGEFFALCAIKCRISKSGKNLYWLYNGLIRDISHNNVTEPYSDGYDVASTAILFLCENLGKKLGDKLINRFGKEITVMRGCYQTIDLYVFHQYAEPSTLNISIDDNEVRNLAIDSKPYTPTEEEYIAVDKTIRDMNLSKNENSVLNCYMAGLNHLEIAAILGINRTTVWRCRNRIAQKYTKLFLR